MKQDVEGAFTKEWLRNKTMKFYLILPLVIVSFSSVLAQDIPIGTWRTHFSYENGKLVAATGSKVFCAVQNGLFYVDLEDNSINKFSKIDGLSDATISAMKYNSTRNLLTVGYETGNIDIILPESIINIDLIVSENISASKEIRDITYFEDNAFLSTDFGIVVIDLNQNSILEVYREIGEAGATLSIYQTDVYRDSLFAITNAGLIKAPLLQNQNLLDFSNWSIISETENLDLKKLVSTESQLYLANDTSFFELNDESLSEVFYTESEIRNIVMQQNSTYILTQNTLFEWTNNEATPIEYTESPTPNDLVKIGSDLWIADENNSLVKFEGSTTSFKPNGPTSDITEKLVFLNDTIYHLGEYRNAVFSRNNNSQVSYFSNGVWKNGQSPIADLSGVSNNFYTSYGNGVLNRISGELIDETNSNNPFELSGDNIFITSVLENSTGTWFGNYDANNSLILFENGSWSSFNISFRYPEKLLSTANNKIVISSSLSNPTGLTIFDPTDQSRQSLNTSTTELPSNVINDFEIDLDDELWIATNSGVAFLPSASSSLFSGFNGVIIPIFENSFLFDGEPINCIEVDPGNRKWMGTSQGAWLFEEAGQSLTQHFTTANSPLPSNNVEDIAINPKTGEVFIVTDKGMVSYRADASNSIAIHQEVKIFPNPVNPGYNSFVGVSGLATDVRVKITDISGKLIREIEANGGAIQWDLKDYNGVIAESGVYLFFSSTNDGSETFVGKLLIVQ
jgi:hypothetical protein